MADQDGVIIYTWGLCHASVCAPLGMQREVVEAQTNAQLPTGIDSKWKVSDETFHTGQPNPCRCEKDDKRLHYLLSC